MAVGGAEPGRLPSLQPRFGRLLGQRLQLLPGSSPHKTGAMVPASTGRPPTQGSANPTVSLCPSSPADGGGFHLRGVTTSGGLPSSRFSYVTNPV